MTRQKKIGFALTLLGILHGAVVLAGFLAPCDFARQYRELPFAPPTRIHFFDESGRLHPRPFVYRWARHPRTGLYEEDRRRAYPLLFFVSGPKSEIAGVIPCRWRLFGVEEPAVIFLLGSDGYGRDLLSRTLYGGQVSLLAGLVAASLSLGIGLLLGTVAGFYGKWLDQALMRGAELVIALPWLYLLLAVRAFLPLHITPVQAFLLLIAIIGGVGWVRPARLVRGVVLSVRERGYVLAARGFGASDIYLMRRHILPPTLGVILTQATVLIPQYILAEVTLSFLGLGVGEPVPSWGNMLAEAQRYHVLASYWWMLTPGFATVAVFFGYLALADALLEPRGRGMGSL